MSNAVSRVSAPVVPADAGSIMEVISRAASDPNTDVDKLERLMAMYERITARNAKAAYTTALAEMQPKLPIITATGKIMNRANEVQSRYAKWENINEVIKPILAEHGFALSFRTGQEGQQIAVTGVLSHREGHSEETTIHLPADTSGSKNAVQAIGSSVSYGKRYTCGALLNMTSRGEDDDGGAAGAAYVDEKQLSTIIDLVEASGADRALFLDWIGAAKLEEIPASKFQQAVVQLKKKQKARQ